MVVVAASAMHTQQQRHFIASFSSSITVFGSFFRRRYLFFHIKLDRLGTPRGTSFVSESQLVTVGRQRLTREKTSVLDYRA